MKRDDNPRRKPLAGKKLILIGAGIIILAAVVTAIVLTNRKAEPQETVTLNQIAAGITSGQVTEIEDSVMDGSLVIHYQDGKTEKGLRDPHTSLLEQLSLLGLKGDQLSKVQIKTIAASTGVATPLGILFTLGIIGIPLGAALYLNRKERWGQKAYEESLIPDVCFKDVAGLDESLQELRDIVTFLKDGSKYTEIGAHMPRGILMVGDPGTGKTLIAKAVAGEAGVPFFATSGSEFVEVFVGVGAGRMRSLFAKARKKAPCIIFIDEIDAVGRARHRSESGAEMEQDQTLNQLLVEMDGFASSENIVVLAATNRLDVLDPALTRPGRFDRRVYINRPDIKGRQAILGIHTIGKKLAGDVNLANVARATPGLVGADLANIVNEAAINAVRNGHLEICMDDFQEAVERIITGGVQRKSCVMSEDERRIIAYHEAGHAVVIHNNHLSDPVFKITIIPRGQAGGYTISLPDQDRMLVSRCKLLARITGLLGGRAAEELFFQDITNGASNDLDVATQLAEEMVMRLGMDRSTGLRVFPEPEGRAILMGPRSSQKTYETIDEAVNTILEDCYSEARRILIEKREYVDLLSNKLLEEETIDQEQFLAVMGEKIPA